MPGLDRTDPTRLPAVTELDRLPPWVLGNQNLRPALVPDLHLDMRLLARFRDLMERCGEEVQLHRMRYDRRYAAGRLAFALDAPERSLRGLAVVLYERYTRPARA